MSSYADDLALLRAAAHRREWTALQDTLKRLLARLEPLVALGVAAGPVTAHLPRFEAYYPEAGWVRELLLTVVNYASAPRDLPLHALAQFPSPGCGNFVSAVFDLARAVQPAASPFERYSFVTNAAANALLAALMDRYFGPRPDEWALLADETARQAVYGRFWLDADVAAADTAAWLALADAVEAQLRMKNDNPSL
ncbi:MAG: hypothetical protein ACUVSX_08630 [Aggregatilineales bacterium]